MCMCVCVLYCVVCQWQSTTKAEHAFADLLPLRAVLEPRGAVESGDARVGGWAVNVRGNKKLLFVELSDGSSVRALQLVVSKADLGDEPFARVSAAARRGAALVARGRIVPSPKPNQPIEMHVSECEVVGACDIESYPLAKPKHTLEHLRTIAHLRPRVPGLAAIMRVRNALAFATHAFYQERGFVYVHTPIVTASDCEGAGEMFGVSTLLKSDAKNGAALAAKSFDDDFFGRPAFLTVSGQLNAEIYACALGKVYTFGPTFRAENSHTTRHLAEFWMIEPEIAFCDRDGCMDNAEAYVKHCVAYALRTCAADLQYLDDGAAVWPGTAHALVDSLKALVDTPFARCSYTEAIELLKQAEASEDFPAKVEWGMDLPTAMERYLAEKKFKGPVFIYDYPAEIKSFYMRRNDDGKTVGAFDLLVPGIGELVGGSQREEREDVLLKRIAELGLDEKSYSWYLDLRRYGTVPHSGFGLGFERLVMLCTGADNIREAVPFPRYPKSCEY